MIQLLESIKNEVWKAFAFRVYNTFIATILPVLAGAVILYFNDNQLPIAVSSFASVELWDFVLGSVIITLLGSITAGIGKATRVVTTEEEISDQG